MGSQPFTVERQAQSQELTALAKVPKKVTPSFWHFCVNFRPVSEITVKDSYPLDGIRGFARFFSLNLRRGNWQVPLSLHAHSKTAFTTGLGLWQCTVMPFGFCNAPATFERLMERELMDVPSQKKQEYLECVLTHGPDFDTALQALWMVFAKIQQAGLKLKPEKC